MPDTCQVPVQRLQACTRIEDNVLVTEHGLYTRCVATIFRMAWFRAGGRPARAPEADF